MYDCARLLSELDVEVTITGNQAGILKVTGDEAQIHRAGVVLNVVDVNEPYTLLELGPVTQARGLPPNEWIAQILKGVVIGTFSDPPAKSELDRVIIDIHKDKVVAIAPQRLATHIRGAMRSRLMPETGPAMDVPSQVHAPFEAAVQTESVPEMPSKSLPTHTGSLPEPITPESSGEHQVIPTVIEVSQINQEPLKPIIIRSTSGTSTEVHREPLGPVSLPNGENIVELDLPEQINLIPLIDLAGEYMDFDILYDPQKITDQPVTLKMHGKLRGEIRVKDLYALLENVLKFKGLAMTRRKDDLVAIVPIEEVMNIDPELVDVYHNPLNEGDMVVTGIFHLEHVGAAGVAELLKTMKLGIESTALKDGNILLVTCYTHRLARIERLLALIDQSGPPRVLSIRPLQYTLARTIAQKVKVLVQELEGTTVSGADTSANDKPARPSDTQNTPLSKEPRNLPVYLDTDERTNRLIIIGLESQLAVINELIDVLDVEQQDLRRIVVYRVNHARAEDVQTKLAELDVIMAGQTAEPAAKQGPPGSVSKELIFDAPREQAQVVVLEATNSLLVLATNPQHAQIKAILEYLDVSLQDLRTIQVYPIKHVNAKDVEAKLKALDVLGGSVSTGQTGSATPDKSRAPRISGAKPSLGEDSQFVVLEATNSLLINATDLQHAKIREIIDYIDVKFDEQAIPYEIYFLENQTPEHMATLLSNIIQETILDQDNKIERVIQTTDERIVIVPDELTFALIVYASKKNQDWISKLITQLDKRRPQVLIDVTLVEIRKTDEFNYDLNLISSFPDLLQTGGQTGSFLVDGQTVVDKLTQPGMRDHFVDLQSNSGLGTGFYADTHVNALLTAMQSKNYGRVLAKPKILVNDNEAGTIKTTDTTYVAKKSSIPVASGGGGTQSTLVETALDYQDYDAGITLNITPHTSDSDLLRLDIGLVRSDFGNITGDAPPDTSSSDLTTVVTVPDGCTIILGGMLKLNQSKGGKKVPILGDIPLVGALFRGVANSDLQNKLYIFVRAEIIRPEETLATMQENLKRISEQNRKAFEQHESEFQTYQSWPGMKAKPTTPEKVLDVR